MVQVENEMGLLGDCRDFSPAAEKAYAEAVPTDAADFCGVNGTWDEAFGEDVYKRQEVMVAVQFSA